jgi:putative ABC transport system permease protein
MNFAALSRFAWRESRTARRRLALYMSAISLGVAALVAIDSFAENIQQSLREQSRSLLGGDLSFSSNTPFPKPVAAIVDSLDKAPGVRVARVTTLGSMALVPRTGKTRLAQIKAVTTSYPLYGSVETAPANQWSRVSREPAVVVDPALLVALDAQVGDTLTLGFSRFVIAGTVQQASGDPGISSLVGPRVYLDATRLNGTGLTGFGARVQNEALIRLPPSADPTAAMAVLKPTLEKARIRARTVIDTERDFTDAIGRLADFLGVVGLIALLLGGIGVASGIHAFVASKIDTIAILRCLGASGRQVLGIYLLQAAVMGLVGALAGAALGVAVQFILPQVVGGLLPLDVKPSFAPIAVLYGVLTGVWVALGFALRPLLTVRGIPPLQALRRASDASVLAGKWREPLRLGLDILLLGSVIGIAIARMGTLRDGLALTLGIAAVIAVLLLAATSMSALARRTLRAGWSFPIRQGIANLYRPANQTRAVTLSLGFGAFLLSTVYLVQAQLLKRFETDALASRGNLLFFDVQNDQVDGISGLLSAGKHDIIERTPLITMRIASINGVSAAKLAGDTTDNRSGWALRREFRSTSRDTLVGTEKLLDGTWFAADQAKGPPYDVSLEQDIMRQLGLTLGDTIVWDVQGVPIATRVTSVREVNWGRFETNFYAVFPTRAMADAPKQYVIVANVPQAAAVAALQRDAVVRYPNVSSLDLSLIRNTLNTIIQRVMLAVRFLGVFCLAMGVPVLFSAVAATRRDRVREGVLLKTIGATRTQVRRVLMAEYGALGVLGAATGMVLSFGGAWALMRWVFESEFSPAWIAALSIAALMCAMTIGIGVLTGRDVYRQTAMAALRDS